MLRNSIFILVLFSVFSAVAQKSKPSKGYEIEVELTDFKDSALFLSYYFGSGQYYRDTAAMNKPGQYIFESQKDTLEHGMYSVIAGQTKIFDFILDNQEISMSGDTADITNSLKFKGSPENLIFFDYLKFLESKQDLVVELKKEMAVADEQRKNELKKQITETDEEVRNYINRLHEEHAGTLTSNFVKALQVPEVPAPPKNEDGSIDSTFRFRYYKSHFLDNIDFSDERLLRTSAYHNKIMRYLEKLTVQDPDSIIKSVDEVLSRAAQNKTLFTYTINNLTAKYERSQQMRMDAVFVHLAKNYYLTPKWKDILSEKQLAKIEERAMALDPLLIGKKAPNIVVKDTAQKKFLQLKDVKAPFTIVYIWSPECGHCKIATPKLKKIYDDYKSLGIEVFAVNNDFENDVWIKFINKHKLDWINGSDGGDFRSNFRSTYDVYSTPQTYLLDENKKILAKKMSMEALRDILDFYVKKKFNKGYEK